MTDSQNALSRQWLQAERAALARARGKKKLDIILDAADPEALVRSLPAEDLYFAVQEIGKADAGPLVQLASPEQFRTFVDLDAWKGETFDPHEMLLWLRLARGDDDDAYREKLAALDIEVVELLLRGIVKIYDLEEDGEPPDDVEGTIERTPEGRFMLVYEDQGAEYAAARRVIDDLYAEDPFKAARMLYAVRWELESELTETGLRWRNARLADLGFPSLEEALSLYARVDRKAPLPPPAGLPEAEPGFFLASLETGSTLLDRAMALAPDEARDAIQLQLVAVLNAALVADRIDVTDVDAVREHAEAVRATLDLGLVDLAGGDDPVRAATILAGTATKRIFQVGFTRTLELKWRAERLLKSLPIRLAGATQPLPDGADGEAFAALLLRRPRYFGGLDGPKARQRVRAFATPAEVERASAMLDRVEAVARAFAAAGLQPEAASRVVEAWGEAGLARARWSDLWATAVAREVAGVGFAFEPLPREALAGFLREAFDADGRLRPSFREAALAAWRARAGEAAGEEALAFAAAALERLESEVGQQVAVEGADGVDARYAAPLIVPPASNVVRMG